MTKFSCPKCLSESVVVTQVQEFYANGLDHYRHTVEVHDGESPSRCLVCWWSGYRFQLKENINDE